MDITLSPRASGKYISSLAKYIKINDGEVEKTALKVTLISIVFLKINIFVLL